MGRRKRTDETGTDETTTAPESAVATLDSPPSTNGTGHEAHGAPPKQRPVASFRCNSDRSTSLEVSVWKHTHRTADGQEFAQYSLTVNRSWKGPDGWKESDFIRGHDVPVLLFLLQHGYQHMLNQRTEVKIDGEPIPF